MSKYLIYFNQQWVGEHSSEWFRSRGPLAKQVVAEMQQAGVLVFAGGLEEAIEDATGADEFGQLSGPITKSGDFIGGLTIIEVASNQEADEWGSKVAIACGWPQEIRKFKD